MAKSNAVWGIDIGQCAIKALRCRPHDQDDHIAAEAFDYIEYPKILSQPDADPVELVREALELFLSRNTVRGDKVAISVSGQSGLAANDPMADIVVASTLRCCVTATVSRLATMSRAARGIALP